MNAWIGLLAVLAAGFAIVAASLWLEERRKVARLIIEARHSREANRALKGEFDTLEAINRGLVGEAPAAMFLVTPDGRVQYLNHAATQLFHLPPVSLEPKPLIELVRDNDLDRMVRRVLNRTLDSDSLEVRPPGTNLTLLAAARAITNARSELLGVAVVLEDLTGLRRMEAARRDLVANVSHELRTPLAGMKALVETLEGGVEDWALAASFLAKLHGEIDRLAFLVRDLLELSRIESGGIRLNCVAMPLEGTLREAASRMQGEAQQADVLLVIDGGPPATVLADRSRCEQVAVNLLQNAIKFTLRGGSIGIGWQLLDGEAIVSVRDTGIGIPEDDLPRIFERFYKVDKGRAHTETSGTGLGLAIVKHLITAMGGRAWAESREGSGSVFSFSLPLASAEFWPRLLPDRRPPEL